MFDTLRLTSIDLRRQKLVDQSSHLLHRLRDIKRSTIAWKSNLTQLSMEESDLTLESSDELRQRVTQLSDTTKKLDDRIKQLSNQVDRLQETSNTFQQDIRNVQLSVHDASEVRK
jgi:uncharacterized protein YhaN